MLALHALGILAVGLAGWLGVWQYGAWQASRELEARDLADRPAQPLGEVLGPDDPFPNDAVGQPVSFTGNWLPESTLEVADRELDGRTGRWLVTPVAVCGETDDCATAPAMLVVRGWLPAGKTAPNAPTGDVEVTGWAQPGEGSGLPDPDPADDVIPELRIASAIQHVDQDLYGGYVVAGDLVPAACARGLAAVPPDAAPRPGAGTSLRNLLYAVEWWVFAGFAAFIWWRWVRDDLDRERDPAHGATDTEPDAETAGIRSSS
jgi:surfeit locus 1 family protein